MIGSSGKPRLVCIVNRPVISRHKVRLDLAIWLWALKWTLTTAHQHWTGLKWKYLRSWKRISVNSLMTCHKIILRHHNFCPKIPVYVRIKLSTLWIGPQVFTAYLIHTQIVLTLPLFPDDIMRLTTSVNLYTFICINFILPRQLSMLWRRGRWIAGLTQTTDTCLLWLRNNEDSALSLKVRRRISCHYVTLL